MEFKINENSSSTTTSFGTLDISSYDEHGFRPFQLMISSIVGCSGSVLRKILVKKRIEVEEITITAEATRNKEEADRIESIHLHFKIKAAGIKESTIEKVLELTRKNCSMVQSVIGSIEITETFELL